MIINKSFIENKLENIKVEYLKTCTSTNKILKNATYQTDTLLIAEEQTSGVGRLNRNFVSNKNKGIYMSLLSFKKIDLKYLSKVTPITAVIVSNAIDELINDNTKIKWVNDIYLKDKKICGILVESVIVNNGLEKLIIGIGINTYSQIFVEELTNIKISRNELIINIINNLNKALDNIDDISYMKEYIQKSNLINKEVIVNINDTEYIAKVLDITLDAELVVEIDNSIYTLTTAEVTKIKF